MSNDRNFLMVTLLLSFGIIPGAMAVPSVKVLGQKATTQGTPSSMATKTSGTTQLPRTASVRNTGSIKTVSANQQRLKSVSETPQRISVGKYIHTTGVSSGVIKPSTGGQGATIASEDLAALQDQIQKLELQLADKQDKLQAGDGIELEDRVISVSDELQDMSATVQELTNTFTFYDEDTGKRKYVSIIDTFDVNVLKGEED